MHNFFGKVASELEVRKKESEPLMEKRKAWALDQSALPGSLLDKALSYMLDLWPGLMRFVEDPRVPIDNNQVERDRYQAALTPNRPLNLSQDFGECALDGEIVRRASLVLSTESGS